MMTAAVIVALAALAGIGFILSEYHQRLTELEHQTDTLRHDLRAIVSPRPRGRPPGPRPTPKAPAP